MVRIAATASERRELFQSSEPVSPFQHTKGTSPESSTSRKPAGVVVLA